MKWSLFSDENSALREQVEKKYGLSSDDMEAMRGSLVEAKAELNRLSLVHAENKKLLQEPKVRRPNTMIYTVLSALKLTAEFEKLVSESVKMGDRVGVVYSNPQRNNDRFVYCLSKNNKTGKPKVQVFGIRNPGDVSEGDLVSISRKGSVGKFAEKSRKASYTSAIQKKRSPSSMLPKKRSLASAYRVTKIGSL